MARLSCPLRSSLILFLIAFGISSTAQSQTVSQSSSAPIATADPISAAVSEASRRFGVPESWIRSVMHVESAGNAAAVSRAGAMGLMQVMPGTYAELRARYGLGANPFDMRDNVLAGTAYLREMLDRYGTTGMLAAYNAGPGRWEEHLAGRRPLPSETVGYLARLAPMFDTSAAAPPFVARPAPRPSPFAAPIFVALSGSTDEESTSTETRSIRQVIATHATVVPSSDELFVRRSSAENASNLWESPATDEDRSTPLARREITASERSVTPSHALFPSRSTTGER